MLHRIAEVRSGERRNVLGAFLTLLGIMISHALLETARDALFLSRLSAAQLPWVYLGIAALALVINGLQERALAAFDHRRSLAYCLVGAGVITGAFWLNLSGNWVVHALYIWSGVMATLVVVRFWALMGDVFTVTQAKRLFALIGAGSVLGAILGSGLARALTQVLAAEQLVPFAAGALLLASAGPLLIRSKDVEEPLTPVDTLQCDSNTACVKTLLRRPYVARLLLLMLVSTITFTVVDFAFKSAVAERVPADELGTFFSGTYLVLNLVSLLVQLTLVGALVRSLGLHRVLASTPLLLGIAAATLVTLQLMAPALILGGVLAMKGVDGALRHSLNRTVSEMLYVPLSKEVRASAKSFIDVAGQRGGQALASLLILLLGLFGHSLMTLAVVAVVLSVVWVAVAYNLRHHYLDLFRDTLQEGHFETRIEYPALDMASLETLISTLNSADDREVLAALDLLEVQERVHLVPAMILYHPSKEIVIAALGMFGRAKRDDFLPITQRLLDHPDPGVRAATLRATAAAGPRDFQPLDQFLDDTSPEVRATALVGLVASQWIEGDEAQAALSAFAVHASLEEKRALARAIAEQPTEEFTAILLKLSETQDSQIRSLAADAMGRVQDPGFLPALVSMLDDRKLRAQARAAMLPMGEVALEFLDSALGNAETPLAVRRHIPRTIHRFDPPLAVPILERHLTSDSDGVVRYKVLRALGSLRRQYPDLPLDSKILHDAVRRTLSGILRLVDWRVHLSRGTLRDNRRATPVQELLLASLEHKEHHGIERLFRLLGLLHPGEDFQKIYEGIRSDRPDVRASSLELLEALLENPLRDALVAFLDELPDEVRVRRGRTFYTSHVDDYRSVLEALLEDGGLALRALTVYHVGELGLQELGERIESLETEGFMEGVVTRAMALLQGHAQENMRYE